MNTNILKITWAKAFGDIYCHHATLEIPISLISTEIPSIIKIGYVIRTNNIQQKKVNSYSEISHEEFLPGVLKDNMIIVHLNSTPIVEMLALNSWTTLKNGVRGTLKEYPVEMYYQIGDNVQVHLPFSQLLEGTPFLFSEPRFIEMNDGDKVNVVLNLEDHV